MRMLNRMFAIVLFAALCVAPSSFAQEAAKPVRNNADVTILIQPNQIRFVAPKSGEELQLQIFDQSGALVFDSGLSTTGEIIWPLLTADGQAMKSGLYAYKLARKDAPDQVARTRSGHFIVDRAADRDSSDKLWITSQSDDKVGVELTAAQSESGGLTGIRLPSETHELPAREITSRPVENDKTKAANEKSAAAALAGTTGRIAKFVSATDVGDSVMSEANGLLNVASPLRVIVAPNSGNNGEVQFGVPNSEAGVTITKDAGRADFRFNGSALKLVAGPAGGPPPDFSGVAVTTAGNVGIGTITPANKLDVNGGIRALFNNSTGVVAETTGGTNAWARFYMNTARQRWFMGTSNNFNGDQFYLWDESANQSRFTIQPAGGAITLPLGNLGIGTTTPATKLHVEGSGVIEATIKSNNERAALVLDGAVGGQRRVWTLENNLSGTQGVFGVFDRTANQARLTIDPAGLVSIKALQLTGGADLAESFDIRSQSPLEPGMVVTIDQTHPGQLNLSRSAYDRRVAGVISGAGGIQPGMRMGQADTLADGQHPVALTGRVYVWADAQHGAIKPGDLLTTSATPGHAMKATNAARAQGAILGKAMTALTKGKGLVLVLVTLQ